jgi:hypothetical protein
MRPQKIQMETTESTLRPMYMCSLPHMLWVTKNGLCRSLFRCSLLTTLEIIPRNVFPPARGRALFKEPTASQSRQPPYDR